MARMDNALNGTHHVAAAVNADGVDAQPATRGCHLRRQQHTCAQTHGAATVFLLHDLQAHAGLGIGPTTQASCILCALPCMQVFSKVSMPTWPLVRLGLSPCHLEHAQLQRK